jgi:hypothetical protein
LSDGVAVRPERARAPRRDVVVVPRSILCPTCRDVSGMSWPPSMSGCRDVPVCRDVPSSRYVGMSGDSTKYETSIPTPCFRDTTRPAFRSFVSRCRTVFSDQPVSSAIRRTPGYDPSSSPLSWSMSTRSRRRSPAFLVARISAAASTAVSAGAGRPVPLTTAAGFMPPPAAATASAHVPYPREAAVQRRPSSRSGRRRRGCRSADIGNFVRTSWSPRRSPRSE